MTERTRSWRERTLAAALAALDHPRWWAIALAGFLVRGGVLLALLPIIILPSPLGLANAFGPALIGFVFGGPSATFVELVAAVVVVIGAWLLGSTFVGAWLDLALLAEVRADEDVVPMADGSELTATTAGLPSLRLTIRAGLARLLAHVPTAIVLAWAAVRIVSATYAELVSPGDAAIPIAIRVGMRAPDAVALLALAWIVGEAAGGLALRAIPAGSTVWDSVAHGFVALARLRGIATLVVTLVVLGLALAPLSAVAAIAWDRARLALVGGLDGPVLVEAVGLFLVIWWASLVLLAVAVAFRQAAWTAEAAAAARAGLEVRSAEGDHPMDGAGTVGGAGTGEPHLAP